MRRLAVVVAIALLSAGVARELHARSMRNRVLARVESWRAQLDARDRTRPVLFGVAVDGEAWEEYEHAIASLPRDDEQRTYTRAVDALLRDRSVDQQAARQSELERAADALEHLLAGARRTHGARELPWDPPSPQASPSYSQLRLLSRLSALAYRERAGQPDALPHLLAVLQLGHDLVATPRAVDVAVGCALFETVYDELVGAPPVSERRALADALERLERSLPLTAAPLRYEFAVFALNTDGLASTYFSDGSDAWRFGFSGSWMLADALDSVEAGAVSIDRSYVAPALATNWIESVEPGTGANSLARRLLQSQQGLARSRAQALTQIRLLRAALAALAGEELILDDPLGEPWDVRTEAGRLHVQSTGIPQLSIDWASADES